MFIYVNNLGTSICQQSDSAVKCLVDSVGDYSAIKTDIP